jgi:hypothetical protein
MLPQPLQVDGRGDTGLGDVGGGLVQGQRQVAQLGGDRCGRVLAGGVLVAGTGGEQIGGRPGLQDIQLDRVSDLIPPGVAAGGEQDVPAGQLPQQRLHIIWVVDVVEDQQPPVLGLQPGDRPPRRLRRGASDRDRWAQAGGQRGQRRLNLRLVFGGDPPHQRVIGPAGMSVVEGQLRLAYPAQPVDRLGHHGGRIIV